MMTPARAARWRPLLLCGGRFIIITTMMMMMIEIVRRWLHGEEEEEGGGRLGKQCLSLKKNGKLSVRSLGAYWTGRAFFCLST